MNEIETVLNQQLLLNAQEARKLTDDIINADIECLVPIMNKIKEAAKQHKYSCYINGSTPNYVMQKLAVLGYKTKLEKGDPRDPREQDLYEIHW